MKRESNMPERKPDPPATEKPAMEHKARPSLRDRAQPYHGKLNLSDEPQREPPVGEEVW